MLKAILLAVPALALATSCVPQQRAPSYAALAAASAPQRPVKDPRELLERLELDVPTDLIEETALARIARPAVYNAAPAFDTGIQAPDDAARALDCLTQAVYYEARSEPVDGERAVAQVVLNRVRDRAFPKSVCGVVYQGSDRSTGCQFTFTCDGSLMRPREPVAWARARAVALAALAGEVYAPVGSATHYHANYVSPWWAPSLTRIGMVGSHIFYRWRDAMENALAFRQRYDGFEPEVGMTLAGAGNGVTVHRSGDAGDSASETVGSVTIHRDQSAIAAKLTPAAAVTTPGAAHSSLVAGVRVHRNIAPPEGAAPEDAGTGGGQTTS
ncbi:MULTISPECIES: cell wall hydrolase [unclassified Sphingomonas]|uniref:cell wall hydrolase n=1 Tax=unclassified Sphingomonas TaxID=196159 RepID=UPI000ABE9D3B|nr:MULTISPECIES: cell wall hydrolase [unclassified Sphingomonas]